MIIALLVAGLIATGSAAAEATGSAAMGAGMNIPNYQ